MATCHRGDCIWGVAGGFFLPILPKYLLSSIGDITSNWEKLGGDMNRAMRDVAAKI
jgi:hypothetical protein